MGVASTNRVTILGAFFVDLVCRTHRMPVWGETIRGEGFALGPGGKGSNQAVAAARQGTAVSLITRLGRDSFADMARRMFEEELINQDAVSIDDALPTGTATILVDAGRGENAIVIAPGACDRLGPAEVDAAALGIATSAYFVSQLELPLETCLYGIRLAQRNGVTVLLNPAPAVTLPKDIFPMLDYITPNETETSTLVGSSVSNIGEVKAAARSLRDLGVLNVVVTLGGEGVFVSGEAYEGLVAAFTAGRLVDTTGAGDAFNGGFVAALAEGSGLRDAARFGCAVAGIAVTRSGAARSAPTRAELAAVLRGEIAR